MPVAKNGRTIILGEDDLEVRSYLETALRCQGYSVEVAQDGDEVLAHLQGLRTPVSAVVIDVIMPGRDGIDTLKEIRRLYRDIPVIMISDASSPMDFVQAMKNGASDFIAKPINPDDLRKVLKMALGSAPLAPAIPDEPAAPPANNQVFSSTSPGMRELQSLVASVGWSEAPVLIQGETGTGKEVFARQLHACSPRAKKSMLKLNCAALPSELVESELFGYERGAFTGAFQKKPGMFECADGGTILLDEIGDMDFKVQAKLLQVLQDHEFQRIGGKDTIRVDVRVIAATHCDLEKSITENRFREDLYYRLNVISMGVPPLRKRKEDIIALAEFFVRKYTAPGMATLKIPPTLQELFLTYHWPGNVRELENMVRKFLIFRDARLLEQDLRGKLARTSADRSVPVATAPADESPYLDVPVAPAHATNGTYGSNGAYGANGSNGADTANGAHWTHESVQLDVPVTPAHAINGTHGANGTNGANGHLSRVPEVTPVLVQVANAKREAERIAILAALRSTNWNRRQAALRLQTDYKGLLYKIKVLSIKKEKPVPVASPDTGEIVRSS